MKEKFVTLDQAKTLKECGFDWECLKFYAIISPERDDYALYEDYSKCYENWNHWNTNDRYSAPTQAMALRWLREVKGVHIEVSYQYSGRYTYIVKSENLHIHKISYEDFQDYESAASVGICSVLKLIKFVN